jgi:hypothetical protein
MAFMLTTTHTENIIQNVIDTRNDSPEFQRKLIRMIDVSLRGYNDIFPLIPIKILTEVNTTDFEQYQRESNTIHLKYAAQEFRLLKKYMNHVYNFEKYAQFTEVNITYKDITVKSNKFTLQEMRQLKTEIDIYTKDIKQLAESLQHFNPPTVTMNIPSIIVNGSQNMIDVDNYLYNIQSNITRLSKVYSSFYEYRENNVKINTYTTQKKILTLKYNLYVKSLQFDINQFQNLPGDIQRNVSEYLGTEYLENIRERCIANNLGTNTKESLVNLLKTWTLKDLRNYLNHVYFKYKIYDDDMKYGDTYSVRRKYKKNSNKEDTIKYILGGSHKITFYILRRDINIISKILKNKRAERRRAR